MSTPKAYEISVPNPYTGAVIIKRLLTAQELMFLQDLFNGVGSIAIKEIPVYQSY